MSIRYNFVVIKSTLDDDGHDRVECWKSKRMIGKNYFYTMCATSVV